MREHARVLVVGLKVADVVDGDQPHLRPDRSAYPREPFAGACRPELRRESREDRQRRPEIRRGLLVADAAFQSRDGLRRDARR